MNSQTRHDHHQPVPDYNRAFALGVALNVGFVVIEAVAGVYANSLALLTDAGHNLSDVLGLLLAWGANVLAGRKPSAHRTYGYSRATILASLASGLLLLAAVGAIAWEAVMRFMQPVPAAGGVIMAVAAIGVVINAATALLFFSGKDHDLNIRGAFLHMTADAAVSLGVVVTGALILAWGLTWADPMISLVIAVVIFLSTWGLLRDSLNLAVDAVPRGIDPARVREFLATQAGVAGIHDLHIWGMSTTETALTAHLVMNALPPDDRFLQALAGQLRERFHIHHATIQFERGNDCLQSEGCAG